MDRHSVQSRIEIPLIIQNILGKADIKNSDVVLEIGSGTGILTLKLLEKAKRVIAVERDPRMVLELKQRVQDTSVEKRLTIINQDIMNVELPMFDLCIANIPYKISSMLTFKLLAHRPIFRAAVVMYQFQFAMRLIAKPGDLNYCRLSVNAHLLSKVSHLLKVRKNNFRPVSKVDSSIVRIEPRNPQPSIDFQEWDGLTRLCFARKNKTLGAIFNRNATLDTLEQIYNLYRVPFVEAHTSVASVTDGASIQKTFVANRDVKWSGAVKRRKFRVTFKELIISVVKDHGFEEQRSFKMGVYDFLKLLTAMNARGIHFVQS